MGYRFSPDDVRYLVSASGTESLGAAQDLALTEESLLTDLTRLRRDCGEHAAAVAETVRLRRLAATRLGPAAATWLLTDEALQQATPQLVAEHRARRLAGRAVHDATCSIGTELVTFAANCPVVLGSDIDPVRVAMARHNLDTLGTIARLAVADALSPVSKGLVGYADPARRTAQGRRLTGIGTIPSVTDLDRAWAGRPMVVRAPPGIDYESLGRPGEVEIVSLDGGAKEAVLWPAELAGPARRATVLRSNGGIEQVSSDEPDAVPVGEIAEYIVDPDPAIVRAHLVRQYAVRHGLHQVDPHLAYLTGPVPPPGVRAFRVCDAAPYRERTVAAWARRDDIGTLEIKQRGTPLVPDELRRRVRSAMGRDTRRCATLIVARIGRRPTAYWCQPVGSGQDRPATVQ